MSRYDTLKNTCVGYDTLKYRCLGYDTPKNGCLGYDTPENGCPWYDTPKNWYPGYDIVTRRDLALIWKNKKKEIRKEKTTEVNTSSSQLKMKS